MRYINDPADGLSAVISKVRGMTAFSVSGQIIDLSNQRIFPGTVTVSDGRVVAIEENRQAPPDVIISPPLINAHNHVESMLLTPSQASCAVIPHGVLGMVSDPHEIANVRGRAGVDYMITDGAKAELKFCWGAPSCVPATNIGIETAGAALSPADVIELLRRPEIAYLAEVMNFPAVLARDPGFMEMIQAARELGKPIDGHAPGLRGEAAARYAQAGISTDHECFTLEEALDKIESGMKIILREGSAARNLDALAPIVDRYPDKAMLCTDDLHPDLALKGSINLHVARLIEMGIDPIKALTAASKNPNEHYGLGLGQLRKGDPADFLIVGGLKEFYVREVYSRGKLVAKDGESFETPRKSPLINKFHAAPIRLSDLKVPAKGEKINVIGVIEGQLITRAEVHDATIVDGSVVSDPTRDILKIAVVNRYTNVPVSVGFVSNFGLRHGALASSVAHDCHNIIAVGVSDQDLLTAINRVIEMRGGLSFARGAVCQALPLPVAGLMSNDDFKTVAQGYIALDALAKSAGGTPLNAPFMTLSFLGLLVIPSAKISDKGIFVDFKQVPASF